MLKSSSPSRESKTPLSCEQNIIVLDPYDWRILVWRSEEQQEEERYLYHDAELLAGLFPEGSKPSLELLEVDDKKGGTDVYRFIRAELKQLFNELEEFEEFDAPHVHDVWDRSANRKVQLLFRALVTKVFIA